MKTKEIDFWKVILGSYGSMQWGSKGRQHTTIFELFYYLLIIPDQFALVLKT